MACAALCATADFTVEYRGEAYVNAGSGDFAPYYIASNVHGTVNSPIGGYLRAGVWHRMDSTERFSWGFGAEGVAGVGKKTPYRRYDAGAAQWQEHKLGPSTGWIQQLYGEVKYRGVFITAGMKEYGSQMLDDRLSSGDLTYSGNTRPLPGFRAGFIDFQNIPLTKGWVQIQGAIGYERSTDDGWVLDHFNRFAGHYNTDWWYNYKYCYFRTKPSERFSVTLGMQAAGQFGGSTTGYNSGKEGSVTRHDSDLRAFLDMLVPRGGDAYFVGNHVGSWDVKARYRLRGGMELSAYMQKPWEDGSGIGFLNGFDGLWGLEFKNTEGRRLVQGAVVEYLDFTNQSGPIHWDVADNPGTNLYGVATGHDNYYNNFLTNGYALYGRSIGTPFIPGPFYNLNGQNEFLCTRVRGFHAGALGAFSPSVDWRMMLSWRKGWGTYMRPFLEPRTDTSMLAECTWRPARVPGLAVKAQVAFDTGRLYGDNFGALISVSWHGLLTFVK